MKKYLLLLPILIYFFLISQVHAAAPTSGLVGYWNFNEGSGTTALDTSGNNNTGSITSPSWTVGKVGSGAIFLDGASSYVDAGSNASLSGGNQITVSAWVKPNKNNVVIAAKNAGWCLSWWLMVNGSNQIDFSIANGSGRNPDKTLLSNQSINISGSSWTHVTAVYDGGTMSIYINGVLDTSVARSGSLYQCTGEALIGAYSYNTTPSNFFSGTIDEARVYNRSLSAQEVLDIYNDGGALPTPTPTTTPTPTPTVTPTPTPTPTPTGVPTGPNIYISQNGAGMQDASSCSSAKPVTFFNTASNWAVSPTTGKISPGSTVHLCGTFTGAVGSTMLTFQGSGTAGNPIILKWEAGAKLTSPAFDRAIVAGGNSYLIFDGNGTSPSITNTANGKGLANQLDSGGISARPCNNCEFKNLSITNIYVQTAPADSNPNGVGISISGSNFSVHDNNFDHMFIGIDDPYQNGDNNLQIYNNTINHMNWGMHIGNNNTNVLTNVFVHDNHLMDMANWDNANFDHHHDGIFIVQNNGNATISNVFVYNNLADGDAGNTATAWIYMNTALNGIYIFNNVFKVGAPAVYVGATSGDKNIYVVNNSIECDGGGALRSTGVIGLIYKNNAMNNCYTYLLTQSVTSPSVDYNAYDLAGSVTGHAFKWDNNSGDSYTTYKANHPGFDTHSITPSSLGVNSTLVPQTGSALLGAGTNLTSLGIALLNVDKNGVPRPASGAWDIGAYQVSAGGGGLPTPVPGDLNLDHIINTLDYSLLNSKWNQNYSAYDLLVDGLINSFDYAVLKSNWGKVW